MFFGGIHPKAFLSRNFFRAIYTVRLCRMRQAYDRPTTRIVSCKSNLQPAYDCRVRQKKCRRILKHVLKSYDNRRYRQLEWRELCATFCMTRAARVACDSRKQKLYRLNRPLGGRLLTSFRALELRSQQCSCSSIIRRSHSPGGERGLLLGIFVGGGGGRVSRRLGSPNADPTSDQNM